MDPESGEVSARTTRARSARAGRDYPGYYQNPEASAGSFRGVAAHGRLGYLCNRGLCDRPAEGPHHPEQPEHPPQSLGMPSSPSKDPKATSSRSACRRRDEEFVVAVEKRPDGDADAIREAVRDTLTREFAVPVADGSWPTRTPSPRRRAGPASQDTRLYLGAGARLAGLPRREARPIR